MNIIILILFIISIVMVSVSILVTITILKMREHINRIILNHNDIIHMLEEENRLLQNRLLLIPNELLISVEKIMDGDPNITHDCLKTLIDINKFKDDKVKI